MLREVDRIRVELGFQPGPLAKACPWCGAEPGIACRPTGQPKHVRLRHTPTGRHPSRERGT